MTTRLLVVGEQRSGTNLLADLLNAQPTIQIRTGALSHALRAAQQMKLAPLDRLDPSQRRRLASALNLGLTRAGCGVVDPVFDTFDEMLSLGLTAANEGAPIIASKDHEPPASLAPLLDRGVYILCIIRDARDVALSRSKRGETDTARSLTGWRRSVRGALTIEHERFHRLRYEDLVRDPVATFAEMAAAFDWPLDLDAVERWSLPADRGTSTSFGVEMPTVDLRPVERWRTHRDDPVVRYACTVCAPELAACGYPRGPTIGRRERARHRVRQAYVRVRRGAGRVVRRWAAR